MKSSSFPSNAGQNHRPLPSFRLGSARAVGLVFVALCGIVAASACTDHYSTQEAYSLCEDITGQNPGINPPGAFNDCVACHENCGDECTQSDDASNPFVCPDELQVGGGGVGGSSE